MIALLFLWLGLAQAARDVQVCGQWTPDLNTDAFDDTDPNDTNGDGNLYNDHADFLYDNTPLRTHGLLAALQYREWAPPSSPPNPWSTAWIGHLTVAGPDGGCTPVVSLPVPLINAVEARVNLFSVFKAPQHEPMSVLDDDTSQVVSSHDGPATTWLVGDDARKTVALGSGDSQIDVAIILAWALNRESGFATGMDWTIYNSNYTNGAGHTAADTKEIWVGTGSNVRRMLHEMGHAVAWEHTSWKKSYAWRNREYTDSLCWVIPSSRPRSDDGSTTHSEASDEATSAAVVEGFATYYAAQTINRVDEGDCYMASDNPKDWDHSGSIESEEQEWFSCDVAPAVRPSLSDGDYWADKCGYPVTGPPANEGYSIASEYDWLRGFWDLDTGYTHDFDDLMTAYAVATFVEWNKEWSYPLADEANRAHRRMEIGADFHDGWNGETDFYDHWMTEALANGMYR